MEPSLNAQAPRARRGLLFFILFPIATAVLAWMFFTQPRGFDHPATPIALVILLACTIALMRWNASPVVDAAGAEAGPLRRGRMALVGLALAVPLFVLPMLLRGKILYGLPVLALIVLAALRRRITRREMLYALGLALAAAAAGLGAGWLDDFSTLEWAALQVPLVLTGLLCGWKVFEQSGLAEQGVGRSRFLAEGPGSALRGFGLGMLMSLPWAIVNILLGGAQDNWVKAWWQPLVAIQPGIAEEAWGRVLMVSLLFLALRWAGTPRSAQGSRAALTAAIFLSAYWFAYLHTDMGLAGITGTVLLGTLYALPISYLCLYRDLETAVGFHFFIDFLRFAAALVLMGG